MQLDIILRTHSTGNVHTFEERFVGATKPEVMLRCVRSLVTSANQARGDIRLWCVDDHSDPGSLAKLNDILSASVYPVQIASLTEGGIQKSALAHFKAGLDVGREVVYFVEDDYLHAPSAVQEMLDAYELFKKNLGGREVALHPWDDPNNYRQYQADECRVVYGPGRHWRTNTHTTNTCMLSHALLRQEWARFERLATLYGIDHSIAEENTINAIWRERALLFSPIPSLALHMQFEQHKDPYIDWRAWWDATAG